MKTHFRSLATKASLVALVAGAQLMPTAAHADEYRPAISPNWNNPFVDPLNNIAGTILAVTLIIGAIAFIVSVVIFLAGKAGGRGGMQDAGVAGMIWTLVGVVLLSSVTAIIGFATGQFSIN